jgi:hypothetical protein
LCEPCGAGNGKQEAKAVEKFNGALSPIRIAEMAMRSEVGPRKQSVSLTGARSIVYCKEGHMEVLFDPF